MGNVCCEDKHPHDAEAKGAPVPKTRGIAMGMSFKDAMVYYHNIAREAHGAPPVTWCDDCASNAQAQADYCNSADTLEHGNCDDQGQNAAMNYDGLDEAESAKGAVQMWYDELNSPGYNYEGDFGAGHFTQVVWKGSTKMGAGIAGRYVIANYLEPGNMAGDYPNNVDENCSGDVSELYGDDPPDPSKTFSGGGGGATNGGASGGGDDDGDWEYYNGGKYPYYWKAEDGYDPYHDGYYWYWEDPGNTGCGSPDTAQWYAVGG